MLQFDKETFFSPLLKTNLSVSLNIKTCGSEVVLFQVHKYSIHFCNCTDLIILLYTFLVICFN